MVPSFFYGTVLIFFGLFQGILIFRILIRMVEPLWGSGSEQTAAMLTVIQPVLNGIDAALLVITYPISFIFNWIASFLPDFIQNYFPHTNIPLTLKQCATLLTKIPLVGGWSFITDLTRIHYDEILPGVMDWPLITALLLLFWTQDVITTWGTQLFESKAEEEKQIRYEESRAEIRERYKEKEKP